jgi:hypothetical protein
MVARRGGSLPKPSTALVAESAANKAAAVAYRATRGEHMADGLFITSEGGAGPGARRHTGCGPGRRAVPAAVPQARMPSGLEGSRTYVGGSTRSLPPEGRRELGVRVHDCASSGPRGSGGSTQTAAFIRANEHSDGPRRTRRIVVLKTTSPAWPTSLRAPGAQRRHSESRYELLHIHPGVLWRRPKARAR